MCLKTLKMAILETQIFNNYFWGSMPPDHPGKPMSLQLIVPPPFKSLWSASG